MRNAMIGLVVVAGVLAVAPPLQAQSSAQVSEARGPQDRADVPTTGGGASPAIRPVATDKVAKLDAPYAQAVVAGGFLFTSGLIPSDPKTGEALRGTIEQDTGRVLDSLESVLRAAGLTLADVVKVTVWVTKPQVFPSVNAVFARRFGTHSPVCAMAMVDGLPGGAFLQLEAVAKMKDASEPATAKR